MGGYNDSSNKLNPAISLLDAISTSVKASRPRYFIVTLLNQYSMHRFQSFNKLCKFSSVGATRSTRKQPRKDRHHNSDANSAKGEILMPFNSFCWSNQIRKQAIPKILENRDVVIAAETGSGKTLSYLLPLVQQLQLHGRTQKQPQNSPDCIILTTSQDLVRQIQSVLTHVDADFAKNHTAYVSSMSTISSGTDHPLRMVFSTPSALLRASKPKDFDFVRHIVVDEADMLLSGGAEKDTKLLLATIRNRARDSGYTFQCIFSAISFHLLKASIRLLSTQYSLTLFSLCTPRY